MGIDDKCPICQEEVETMMHALRDCFRVRSVWRQLGVSPSNQYFWRLETQDWMAYNGNLNLNGAAGNFPWKMIFPFAMCNIWKSRNGCVFNGKNPNPNLTTEVVNQVVEFMYCASSPRGLTHSIITRMRWEKPQEGWVNKYRWGREG